MHHIAYSHAIFDVVYDPNLTLTLTTTPWISPNLTLTLTTTPLDIPQPDPNPNERMKQIISYVSYVCHLGRLIVCSYV